MACKLVLRKGVVLAKATCPLLLAIAVADAGCTWIKLTDAGAEVAQGAAGDVLDCQLVGTVRSTTQNRVVFQRGRSKVAEELIVLARNEAVGLGGDTIVPQGPMVDGRQNFNVYRCRSAE